MHRDKKNTSIICEKMLKKTFSNHQTAANLRKLQRFVLVLKVLLTLQPVNNYQKLCSLEFYGCSGPNREPDFFQLIVPNLQIQVYRNYQIYQPWWRGCPNTRAMKKNWLFRAYRRLYIDYTMLPSYLVFNHKP